MTVRLAALGDSITVGLGDPVEGGWRGFASLMATSAEFRNFAQSGALTADVVETQLPQALSWRPDIATVVIGVNDTLRGAFDINMIERRLNRVFGELSAAGVHLVTACLPEPGRMLRLPKALARPLARRMAAVNDIIHLLSAEYPVSHAHIAADPLVYDRRMWSVDRLHPNELGHRYLASLCHGALTRAGWALGPPPGLEAQSPPPTRRAQAWWMATQGTRWIIKRSNDLLPQLIALALAEVRSAPSSSPSPLPSPEPLVTQSASPT